ncbi:MAG: gsiB 1 [Actinomycetia bacterium]|nr:gsiB 1 [Actinomycetes bacterium]
MNEYHTRFTRTTSQSHGSRLALVVTVVAVLALGGCGGGSSPSSPTTTQSVVRALPASTKDVDTITWDLPHGEPGSIDILNGYDYSPDLVIANLCDSLDRLNPDFTVAPGLAVSRSQPDPLTLIYKIRSGVNFWDGKPLTNVDVAWSLGRNLSPDAPSHFLYASVKSIKATANNTVTIRFSKPDELFAKEMFSSVGAVMEKAFSIKQGKSLGTAKGSIMCSGPFKLANWTPGSSMTLVRNEAYWDPQWKARSRMIKLKFITVSSPLTQGLKSGELDGAYEIPPTSITSLQSISTGKLYYGPSHQYLALSVVRPDGPLASTKLRDAVLKAIDRPALASSVFHGAARANYTALASTSWDPSALPAYEAAYKQFETANSYDTTAAKQLVKESGYSGHTLSLVTLSGDDTQSAVGQFIQQQAASIGVKVKINALQPLEYSNLAFTAATRKSNDLLLSSNYNQSADPLEQLSFNYLPGSPFNYTNYSNPVVTTTLKKGTTITENARRAQAVIAAQAVYEKDYKSSALVTTDEVSFVNKRLTGAITSFAYMFTPSLAKLGAAG